ncbi:MAG TPA: putative addiction module antidote protein [Oceanospirillaceae bacterium]|nr:putative addiction module antidote protein [Oceanospirillaceae bacterium]
MTYILRPGYWVYYVQQGNVVVILLSGDDSAFIVHALGVIARAKNMSQLARDTGLTREGLYKALSSDGNPTFSTIAKVAKALGLQITVQAAH